MARYFLSFVAFALVGLASAGRASFVPHSAIQNALSVRGGDHLDPTDTAKVGTLLAGGHAALTLMSPSRMAGIYGSTSTPMTDHLAQWQGCIVLSFCLQAWQLIVKGVDLKTSLAVGVIPT